MIKKALFLVIFLTGQFFALSDEWTGINAEKEKAADIILEYSDIDNSIITFRTDGFSKNKVITPKGASYTLHLPDATPILKKGAPDLPKLTASVIIPDRACMEVEIVKSSFKEYHNIDIAPSKGNLYRDIDPASVAYEYGPEYNTDRFFPGDIAMLRDPYIVRDYRGQTVLVHPFQYNPVTKTLRVYTEITIKITARDNNGKNPLVRTTETMKINREFRSVYHRHFLNAGNTRYTPVGEFGDMLIISYGDFMDEMDDFVDWQIQKGTPCEIVDVSTVGNSASAIKSYINNYYNNHDLTYVILVGDADQVAASYASGDSDNEYTYLVGNDHYPDILIGRLSAETESEVITQVERTLEYEKNPYTDNDWYTTATGIASDQGPGDDNEYDYEHIRNIHDDLLAFTYENANELFDGSQGGQDEPGNPTPDMVTEAIENGNSIINYTGHGSTSSWGTSGFSNSHINSLTNEHMWPFIFSVACVNGNFVGSTCFAEAWLRAENNGNPTGAIATIMSTINQSWDPPMCGQDEMNDILCELKPGNIKRSFAGIALNGCMQMNDEYGSAGDEMTDTWTVFGDPSVFVRTAVPEDMTTSYSNVAFLGDTEISISSNAEGGLVCLTYEGEIMASGFIEDGSVTLEFPELEELGIITVAITAFNFKPHIGSIQIIQPDGPYLVYDDHDVNDMNGNNNGSIDYGESILLDLTLENMGLEDGQDINASINTSSSWLTMSDNTEVFELIPAQGTATVYDGYAFRVDNNVPDMTEVEFTLNATNGDDTWESKFDVMIYAPLITIVDLSIVEDSTCNGNGILDPGETVEIKIENNNTGHSVAYNTIADISVGSPYITIGNTIDSVGNIAVLQAKTGNFTITADSATPQGENITVEYELSFPGQTHEASFDIEVGMLLEDWETYDFTRFDWEFGGDQNWIISEQPYEGEYSSASGNISNNETSSLIIDIEVEMYDEISFYYKVSSETNRDKLQFYINNNLKGEWSGEKDWTKADFPITSGNHTLKWIYTKDGMLSFGDDCAWIDNIKFPAMPVLNAFAGQDNYTCNGMDFQCEGIAKNFSSLEWTTSGDGNFDDPTIQKPLYTPGTEDISNGEVILTLEAFDDEGNSDIDNLTLSITEIPVQPEQAQGPVIVNTYETPESNYSTNPEAFIEYYEWYLEPEEAGEIFGSSNNSTVVWNNEYTGIASVSVAAINDCGTSEISEVLEVSVNEYVGIEPVVSENWIIYPNPANNLLSVELNNFKENDITFKLLDITGSVVISKIFSVDISSTHTMNIEHLKSGLYFVVVETNNSRNVKKLMIK